MNVNRSASELADMARSDLNAGYLLDGQDPEEYVGQLVFAIESGDLPEIAGDWARQQNEYVYTSMHFDVEAECRYTDEWMEAEREAARTVAARYRNAMAYPHAKDAGAVLLDLTRRMRCETVAMFLANVYTTAVWDWLGWVRYTSTVADAYLNELDEQAKVGLLTRRDVPYLD